MDTTRQGEVPPMQNVTKVAADALRETFGQLDELLVELASKS